MKSVNRSHFFAVMMAGLCWQCSMPSNEKPLVDVAGTVVSLSPPEGFVQVPALGGFKHEKLKATIMVVETPKTFSIVSDQVKEGSMKDGMKVLSKEKIDLQGKQAMLYHLNKVSQYRSFNQWMLVFAHNRHTTSVMGTYLAKDEALLSDNIKSALLSTHVSEDESALIRTVPFTVNMEGASLMLAKVLTGPSLVYTADGVWSDSSLQANSFYVGNSLPQKDNMPVTEDFARAHMGNLCASCEVDSTSIKEIAIDNLKGIELWAYTKDTHKLKYQVILHDGNHYFIIVGTASNNQPVNLETFRSLSKTFRRRSPSATRA
jgi:hypothetical protein